MGMNAILNLEPYGQSLLSLLATLAPSGGGFPGTPYCGIIFKNQVIMWRDTSFSSVRIVIVPEYYT